MEYTHAACTDIGLRRSQNEDAYGVADDINLYVIADGMGGHAAGEVASRMAVTQVITFIRESILDESLTWPFGLDIQLSTDANRILSAIRLANQTIYDAAAAQSSLHGMGTTLVLAFFRQNGVYIAHVGDSRAYRIRRGNVLQITRDHSLLEDRMHSRLLISNHSGDYPFKNVITRALGVMKEVRPDIQDISVHPGDRYLLCTDGLTDMLSLEEIREILDVTTHDLSRLCQELVNAANARGGKDNITVILVDCF